MIPSIQATICPNQNTDCFKTSIREIWWHQGSNGANTSMDQKKNIKKQVHIYGNLGYNKGGFVVF